MYVFCQQMEDSDVATKTAFQSGQQYQACTVARLDGDFGQAGRLKLGFQLLLRSRRLARLPPDGRLAYTSTSTMTVASRRALPRLVALLQ